MLSGAFQGRVLSMISKLIQPKNVLEIGTYTGYSAICIAEGLASDGVIHTLDKNEELEDLQNKYFEKDHGLKPISTGDMLRAAVSNKTELGIEAKNYMDEGKLVPDSLIINLVKLLHN